jgi:crotonobetainyl-CoA:carnitine CoA-transferase CaiB-like acyl-CoA transferase
MLQIMASTIAGWDGTGGPPTRSGSRVRGGAPRNVYRTRDDRWIAVSATTDAQVGRLLPLLGQDTPEGRDRYGTTAARLQAADELDALVAEWVRAHDRHDVLHELLTARVGVAPVNDARDIRADPHIAARGNLDPPARPAPDLGAHTDEVLEEWR